MTDYIVRETEYPLATGQEVMGELIRCRDCKWWDSEYRECNSPNWDTGTEDCYVTPAGFFCGWAERREE